MVGAAITAAGGVGSSTGVRSNNSRDILGQSGIDEISVDSNLVAGREASHVLVQHGQDVLAIGLVLGEDSLGTQKATLLTAVPVELDGVLGLEARLSQDTEGLEDGDGAGTVVVGAGAAGGGGAGSGVHVGTDDDEVGLLAGNLGDDGGLVVGVGEAVDGDGGVGGTDFGDLVKEPS